MTSNMADSTMTIILLKLQLVLGSSCYRRREKAHLPKGCGLLYRLDEKVIASTTEAPADKLIFSN
jgi:hypothetical protein